MGLRSIRFPDGLEAKVRAVAVAEDRSFSYVVLRAVEKALVGLGPDQSTAGNADGPGPRPAPPVRPASSRPSEPAPQKVLLRCPVAGCSFAAASPNAICNSHGKKVR